MADESVAQTLAGTSSETGLLPSRRIEERDDQPDWRGRAKPGPWYGQYYRDWDARHPGAWIRGQLVPGGFYSGNLWGSSMLKWDAEWFRSHGAKMPKGAHYIRPGRNTTPLTTKHNPTDTGVMRFQFEKGR